MKKDDGSICTQDAGWGTDRTWGPCTYHLPSDLPDEAPTELPEPIPEDGERVYVETIQHLQRHNLYDRADKQLITAFVLNVLKMREAYQAINEDGWIDHDNKNDRIRKHPAAKLLRDATNDIKKLGNSLGLSPNARSQISVPDDDDEGTSEMESILDGSG